VILLLNFLSQKDSIKNNESYNVTIHIWKKIHLTYVFFTQTLLFIDVIQYVDIVVVVKADEGKWSYGSYKYDVVRGGG